jgi:surface glycoprotein (TIGR04207 family)
MTDYNDKIRAVVLAALMVLSVFAGTVAFAGTASATVSSFSNPSVADVQTGSSGTTQSVTIDVETDASSGNNVTIDYDTANITGVSVNSIADTRSASAVVVDADTVNVTIDDGTADGADTGTLDLTVTHNLTGVSTEAGVNVDFTGDPGTASTSTSFDITTANSLGPGSTVYLGDTVDLSGYSSTSFTGEATGPPHRSPTPSRPRSRARTASCPASTRPLVPLNRCSSSNPP